MMVDDLDAASQFVTDIGGELTSGPIVSATGRVIYARHPDGTHVEYVRWSADLRAHVLHRQRALMILLGIPSAGLRSGSTDDRALPVTVGSRHVGDVLRIPGDRGGPVRCRRRRADQHDRPVPR
ncbi:hypothetical protein ACWFPY_34645 [Nocardia fluminea]